MNTYSFTYSVKLPSGDFKQLSFKCEARRLSSAVNCFYITSKASSFEVCVLNPRYEVVNSVGKLSYRLLPAKYLLSRG